MGNETIKSLRTKADELSAAGITNRETLLEALPVLVRLKELADFARKNLAASVVSATRLSELCTKYAKEHPGVFDAKRLVPNQQGVLTGDISLEGGRYHLACGYDGYERTDEGKLTKEFLDGLPEAWRKKSYKIDVTGINNAAPTPDDLAQHGLRAKAKNVWSFESEP